MPRNAREKSESGVYYIFANGEFSKPLTKDDDDKRNLIDLIFQMKQSYSFDVFAYAVTKNELHMVIKEYEVLEISKIMKGIFGKYTANYNGKYKTSGGLLHDRFKSTPINANDSLKVYVRYVHQVPMRLLESKNASSYEFSSYSDYFSEGGRTDKMPILYLFGETVKEALGKFKVFNAGLELQDFKGKLRRNMSMQDLIEVFNSVSKMSFETYQNSTKEKRYEVAKVIKKKAKLSYRQMEALLGISRSTLLKL